MSVMPKRRKDSAEFKREAMFFASDQKRSTRWSSVAAKFLPFRWTAYACVSHPAATTADLRRACHLHQPLPRNARQKKRWRMARI